MVILKLTVPVMYCIQVQDHFQILKKSNLNELYLNVYIVLFAVHSPVCLFCHVSVALSLNPLP